MRHVFPNPQPYWITSSLNFCFDNKVFYTFFVFYYCTHIDIVAYFFILFDSTNVANSSLNILLMIGLISIIDPGNMQHSLSLASVLGKSTFNIEEEVFNFLGLF